MTMLECAVRTEEFSRGREGIAAKAPSSEMRRGSCRGSGMSDDEERSTVAIAVNATVLLQVKRRRPSQ